MDPDDIKMAESPCVMWGLCVSCMITASIACPPCLDPDAALTSWHHAHCAKQVLFGLLRQQCLPRDATPAVCRALAGVYPPIPASFYCSTTASVSQTLHQSQAPWGLSSVLSCRSTDGVCQTAPASLHPRWALGWAANTRSTPRKGGSYP